VRAQLFLKLHERDVRRPCHFAKREVRLVFDAARPAVAALALRRDVALLLQPVKPADRARRAKPEPLRYASSLRSSIALPSNVSVMISASGT
jgi:hypothetical protein